MFIIYTRHTVKIADKWMSSAYLNTNKYIKGIHNLFQLNLYTHTNIYIYIYIYKFDFKIVILLLMLLKCPSFRSFYCANI